MAGDRMISACLWTIAVGCSGPALAEEKPNRLAVIQKAPEFTLTDQAGERFSSADLKGKVWLVSFVFTTCNGTCPATTHRMGQIQQALKDKGHGKDDQIRLLSITLDPARDTQEVLRGYMKQFDADPATWRFLTGKSEDVNKVVAAWRMWAKPAANGQLDHPSRIFLVDRKRQVREIYHLGFLKAPWVVEDVELLLKEAE
jgi:protein SCO1/2